MELGERFVISELTGGLGNQLFQYAAARALCLREQRNLYFAWHLHSSSTARRYLLDQYKLGARVERRLLSQQRLAWLGLRSPLFNRKVGKLWQRLWCKLETIKEQSFCFQPLASAQAGVVLDGYFQSWRYFADYAEDIRHDLTLARPLSSEKLALLAQIASDNAVGLHVRRGDYVSSKDAAAFHGTLDLGYYQRALTALGDAAHDATIYVFSDDPAWSRAHVQLGKRTVIVAPEHPDKPWEDLHLFSACRHFVIANSSFSWWGAWLSSHPGKRVVAPERWFSGASHDTRDLCPPDWIRV